MRASYPFIDRLRAKSWEPLIIGGTLATLLAVNLLTKLDLAPDEAHYWEWSRRLDLAYFSKGPAVAYLVRFGTTLLGHSELGVRIPALLCYGAFLVLFSRYLKPRVTASGRLVALTLVASSLIFVQTGFAMTTDPPAILAWLLYIWSATLALETRNSKYWILAFAACGAGALAKYTLGILVPATLLILVLSGTVRETFKQFSFWLGGLLFAVLLSPVVLWNMRHGWVNVEHNAAHLAIGSNHSSWLAIRPEHLPELLAAQLALAGPWVVVFGAWAMFRAARDRRNLAPSQIVWLATAVSLAGVCVLLSLTRSVYANWPLPLYVSLIPLTVSIIFRTEAPDGAASTRALKTLPAALGLNALLLVAGYALSVGITFFLPLDMLPTKKLMGWDEASQQVEALRAQHLPKATRIIGTERGLCSELAFYMRPHPRVFCANVDGRKLNQYDVWGGWERLKGKDLLVVLYKVDPIREHALRVGFRALEPIGTVVRTFRGEELGHYQVYIGRHFRGKVSSSGVFLP